VTTPRITSDWIARPATQAVMEMLEAGGHRAWFVGGCVRDALAGRPVSDVDIATDALPEVTVKLAEAAGLRAVPTGIDHGTVTVVAGGIPHEVTTLRRDVETDGRRAVVAFSDNIAEDAARRDFTMNALYARRDGEVLDPVGEGLADLAEGRVRFIGEAEMRIREDYLRILRFFRFHAGYGRPDGGLDREALAAIAATLDGLDTLPGERTGHEMRRLLAAPDPAPAVAAMAQTGVLARVLPGSDTTALAPLVHLEAEAGRAPDPILRLTALGGDDPADVLRLSREEAKRHAAFRDGASSGKGAAELGYRLGADLAVGAMLLRAASAGVSPDPDVLPDAARGAAATFPVKAADLMPGYEGPALGEKLAELEARWIASGFTLDRDALLG
jgi:poly(A) polymerase